MKIKSAVFAHCAGFKEQLPPEAVPEIAFAGRSNVGKSSLINCLVQRKALARTSGQPGKTQTVNFYLVNDALYLVDLPGYGYARVPQAVRNRWKSLLEGYLSRRGSLKGVVLVVDSRHPPMASDVQMFQWLLHYRKPVLVVATKTDKLSRREYNAALQRLEQAYAGVPVLPCSALRGSGRDAVWKHIWELATS
ncbi:MAG TPA: ribosome biogenesis GTP-binding protein YihA/YsxC [Bacillota bacterium]|nr:ribosome biogenesis GTP-binding protein YihA/YsxC [Bacillota bacterium]HQE02655.1 ribosome biogenesis GTP-binding protein YihA/YsxC [Bacillota bacterium]